MNEPCVQEVFGYDIIVGEIAACGRLCMSLLQAAHTDALMTHAAFSSLWCNEFEQNTYLLCETEQQRHTWP